MQSNLFDLLKLRIIYTHHFIELWVFLFFMCQLNLRALRVAHILSHYCLQSIKAVKWKWSDVFIFWRSKRKKKQFPNIGVSVTPWRINHPLPPMSYWSICQILLYFSLSRSICLFAPMSFAFSLHLHLSHALTSVTFSLFHLFWCSQRYFLYLSDPADYYHTKIS